MNNDITKLADLQIGDMYFIPALARVVRVEAFGEQALPRLGTVKTVILKGTLPHIPIKGLVSEKQAAQNLIALNGSSSHTVDEDFDDREWTETWAERMRAKLINPEGKAARLGHEVLEVYCLMESRQNRRIRRCSNFFGMGIEGVKIPTMKIFREDFPVIVEKPTVETKEPVTDINKMRFKQLQSEAKKRGIDTSDISGAGASDAIRKRLNNGVCV